MIFVREGSQGCDEVVSPKLHLWRGFSGGIIDGCRFRRVKDEATGGLGENAQ